MFVSCTKDMASFKIHQDQENIAPRLGGKVTNAPSLIEKQKRPVLGAISNSSNVLYQEKVVSKLVIISSLCALGLGTHSFLQKTSKCCLLLRPCIAEFKRGSIIVGLAMSNITPNWWCIFVALNYNRFLRTQLFRAN